MRKKRKDIFASAAYQRPCKVCFLHGRALLTVRGGSPAEYVLPVFELSRVARLEKAILV
jgi:hypothetical protein